MLANIGDVFLRTSYSSLLFPIDWPDMPPAEVDFFTLCDFYTEGFTWQGGGRIMHHMMGGRNMSWLM